MWSYHQELLASKASQGVRFAKCPGHHLSEGDQQLIAPLVPMAVVYPLEVIEVQQQYRKWQAMSACSRNLFNQADIEISPVEYSGQGIGARFSLKESDAQQF